MISAVVLTKNNEDTIGKVLQGLAKLPEVLVVDTGSSDATKRIASEFPNVRIEAIDFQGFGNLHNKASERAKYDWILSIDSDEIVTNELMNDIFNLELNSKNVYSVERQNYFFNKRIKYCSGWHPDRVIRLYNKKKTRFSEDEVHERVLSDGLKIIPLKFPLLHFPYRSIDQLLPKMELYTSLFAKQNSGKKSSLSKALWHGFFAFFRSFVLKRGFLGGKYGFIISLYNGHTAYYKYLKLVLKPAAQTIDLNKVGRNE